MFFTINREEFLKGLHITHGVASKRSSLPILSHLLVEAKEDHNVFVTATDFDIGITTFCKGEVNETGSIALPSRYLYDIVKLLPKDTLTLRKIGNERVELICGSTEYRIPGMQAENFPSIPRFDNADGLNIKVGNLKDMIKKTVFAICQDEARYNLTGLFMQISEKRNMLMVATDGHRLAVVEGTERYENPKVPKEGAIIPRKAIQEVKRIIDTQPDEKDCFFGFKDNHSIFRCENVNLVTKMVDAQFPDFRQVIPESSDRKVNIKRDIFLNSLKRVSLMAPEQSNAVRVVINSKGMELSTTSSEGGEAKEFVEVDGKNLELQVNFNARYLIDVLDVISDDNVVFEVNDDSSPAVIKPEQSQKYTCIVMPMRV